jgi:cation:H+ antiporter
VADALLALAFAAAAAVSLSASWLLVTSLERVGARVGLSEGLLGMLAALAADAPEITAAVTALLHGDQRVGAGVIIGSNVFNLAALIGLAGIVSGAVALHRRVVELAGAVALWVAAVTLAVVARGCSPAVGLVLVLLVLVPYAVVLGLPKARVRRLRIPARWSGWLASAVAEEELELAPAIHPRRGRTKDALGALTGVAVVVGASIGMEEAASRLGERTAVPSIIVGAIVLAGVTSLPNAVSGVYLALRRRGSATLSTSFNSNAINVLAGLLLPTTLLGLAAPSSEAVFIAAYNVAMTALVVVLTLRAGGLDRRTGTAIVAAYLLFAAVLVATA